jgi:hypothetical protein
VRVRGGAGDENRTRTISLGIGPIGSCMLRDLRGCLTASDRHRPLLSGCNCTLIARLTSSVTGPQFAGDGPRRVRAGCRPRLCQCCAQEKDARRPEPRRRCCAIGKCCGQFVSPRTVKGARATLRAALTHAVNEDELISRNVATMVRLPAGRVRKVRAWSVTEACQFLESARADHDPLYAGYVLMLVLGLRLGEVLGLPWASVNLDAAEVDVSWQLQRVGKQLHHRETKTRIGRSAATACDLRGRTQAPGREAGKLAA